MRRWFRPRPGVGDDVVHEMKSLWYCLVPARFGWGYHEYANAASARNRISHRLNDMAAKMSVELHKFALAEADLKAERAELKDSKFNHLGIGKPYLADPRVFKEMLPYVDEPDPVWKKFISSPVWKMILREHGADATAEEQAAQNPKTSGLIMVSPSDAVDKHPRFYDKDGAEQLVRFRPENEKKKTQSGNSQGKKHTIKTLRSEFSREEGEIQSDWDKRLKDIADERNNDR